MRLKRKPKSYDRYRSYRSRQKSRDNNPNQLSLTNRIIVCALLLLFVIMPVILKDTWVGQNKVFLEKVFLAHITFDDVKDVSAKIFTNNDVSPVVKSEESYTLENIPDLSLPVIGQISEEEVADNGVIITAPEGYPVVSVLQGKIVAVRQSDQSMEVEIDHGKGLTTVYTYLQAVGVKPNDEIQKGTIIGYTGKFNNTSGVSFTVRLNGTSIDARNIIAGK